MAVLLGGDNAYKVRVIGDIVVSYQYVNEEPAMVIYPKIKRTLGNGAYAICLSSAYKYAEVDYLIQQSKVAAEQIGMDITGHTVRRIADCIIDGLPDLIEMPPERTGMNQEQGQEIGEMLIKVDGQTIAHKELTVPTSLESAH